jgi:hypothetical protein
MKMDAPFIDVDEYQAKYANRLYGVYSAIVKSVDDPKRLGRIKVISPSVYGEDLSPWVTPCFPTAVGVDSGDISIPPLHSYVWMTFEEGDPRSPIYLGGFSAITKRGRDSDLSQLEESDKHQDNSSPLPLHAQGLPDGTDTEGTTNDYRNIPSSSFKGEYGKVHVKRTEKGNIIELNDSEESTRIFISHGPSGAYYEIRHDGTIVESTSAFKRSLDNGIHSVHEGKSIVEYDSTLDGTFGGRVALDFLNRVSINLGNESIAISPGLTAVMDDIDLVSNGQASLSALSVASLSGADGININSGGNRTDVTSGTLDVSATNALDPTGLGQSMLIEALNGLLSIKASDRLGAQSVGLEAIHTGVGAVSDVYLGSLTAPSATRRSPTAVPLLKEGVVMGSQLQLALASLIGIFQSYATLLSTGGTTPGFGGPNPILATANLTLMSALSGWLSTYGTPQTRGNPIYASDSVFVSK